MLRTLAIHDLADGLTSQSKPKPRPEGDTRKILLIRHGATSLNNDDVSVDRVRGWKDIPLSPDGVKEVERLGDKIKRDPPDVLVTSDLKRACETAKIISARTGVPVVEITKAFRPWDVGSLAGQLSKKIVPVLADYASNKPDEPVSSRESFNDFRKRFLGGLKETLQKYDGVVGIVTHHRGERLLRAWAAKGFPPDGAVDIAVFSEHGGATGSARTMQIPMAALQQFGEAHRGNSMRNRSELSAGNPTSSAA